MLIHLGEYTINSDHIVRFTSTKLTLTNGELLLSDGDLERIKVAFQEQERKIEVLIDNAIQELRRQAENQIQWFLRR